MRSKKHVLGLCFRLVSVLLKYFFVLGIPLPPKKDNRCRITPLPSHNRDLSTTATLLSPQNGRLAGRFHCGFMQDTNAYLRYTSWLRRHTYYLQLGVLKGSSVRNHQEPSKTKISKKKTSFVRNIFL